MRGAHSAAAAALCLVASALGALAVPTHRELIQELAPYKDRHITVPCSPSRVGSLPACYNASISAENNVDFTWGSPSIDYPKDGSPWGVHISGPYPDSKTYLFSWHSGASTVGPSASLPTNYCKSTPSVKFSPEKGGTERVFKGQSISYQRDYLQAAQANYSYASPCIHHVVVDGLAPGTAYKYQVSVDGRAYGKPKAFKTLKVGAKVYPLKVGLIADLGQTNNSTETRDHAYANKPDVIFFPGDHSYADDYGPETNDNLFGSGTNQNRWDSYMYLMEKLFSKVPVVTCYGNHEIEGAGIASVINYTTTSFSYPQNYPFQSASHRWPAPGTTSGWTNITQSLYYSTVVGGQVKVIALNNYIPFGPGTPQHQWATKELAAVDRKATPWLVVMFHAPAYHTYFTHYKEMDYLLSVYEEAFYKAGVDFVFNGHVHAYERTHAVYKYKRDDCGPMYVTIGDGGNIEGPYRNFVDQTNPYANNVTYCSTLAYGGKGPNELQATNGLWGPGYQTQAYPPGAQTLSWQAAYGVGGGPVLVPLATNKTVGFCQSSQPKWSAHRDPSFGHGILTFLSSTKAELQWFKNVQGRAVEADKTVVVRNTCSMAHRMRRLAERQRTAAQRDAPDGMNVHADSRAGAPGA